MDDYNHVSQDDAPPPAMPVTPVTGAAGPPPKKRGSGWKWFAGCGCLLLAALAGAGVLLGTLLGPVRDARPFGSKVALIYLDGPITSGGGGGMFGGGVASSERLVSDLRMAYDDKSVRAIVLRINSPGGSAAASQEIYQEVLRIRQSGRPVVVSMGDVAASGGYYVACAANRVFANSGTLTGSIGVIIQATDMSQLFGKIGLKPETVKSGKFKDMFSPNRPVTDEERALAKSMILDIYYQFVEDVLTGRQENGLTRRELLAVADGRVLTGRQAREAKLIDEIGSLQDAIAEAGRMAGISGRPNIWRVKRTFWETIAESASNARPSVTINLSPEAGSPAGGLLRSGE